MLSLVPGSSCDICFELYGNDNRTPCAMQCGHVYCMGCLQELASKAIDPHEEPVCPTCRRYFEFEDCIQLRIDSDNVVGPSLADEGSATEIENARQLWGRILSLSDGATEGSVRQLVAEAEAFFKSTNDKCFNDLKSAVRIVNHLYDLKIKSRNKQAASKQTIKELEDKVTELQAANAALTAERDELRTEKDNMEKAMQKADELHRHEADLAAAVEQSLRSHFMLVKEKEADLSQLLKKIKLENADMLAELQQLRGRSAKDDILFKESKTAHEIRSTYTLPSSDDYLDDTAAINPDLNNYFLTPLLGGSDSINAILNNMEGIDELSEESQTNTDSEEYQPIRAPSPDYPIKPTYVQEIKPKASTEGLTKTFLKPPKSEPSGLSRTAPHKEHQRRDRSYSSPSQPQSRAQSPFKPMVSSACPTPPIQTDHHAASAFAPFGLDETSSVLHSRLQDILSDTRGSSPSSSLPTPPSKFFSSSLSSKDNSSYPTKGGSPPTSQETGPVKMSSASAQAKVLEDERRRRRGEEMEHRRMLAAEAERERERVERERRPSAPIPVPAPSSSASGQAARQHHQHHSASSYTQQQHYGLTPPSAYSHAHSTQLQNATAPSRRGSTSAGSLQAHYAARSSNHVGVSPSQEQLSGSAQRYPPTPSSMTRPSSIPVKKPSQPGYPSIPSSNPSVYI